ncbi:aspartic proteinase NANA, chloroplast-like [Aristolochia californica]|uniref:aspartic proteinase NANA, chloroplast-like n=1 Tax=Aristolochia californica TaxID=171875 RepID=UPI0035E1C125
MSRKRNLNLNLNTMCSWFQTFLLLLGFFATTALAKNPSRPIRFELIHRHAHELSDRVARPLNRSQRVQELLQSDNQRTRMISEMVHRRRAAEIPQNASSFSMPLFSGAYSRTGQYFVRFRVGTPAQRFLLVADTGSDLTWMNCRYNCPHCEDSGRLDRRRIFYADRSRTFRPISCASNMCKNELPLTLTKCPTPASPCLYDYRYGDGSSTLGFHANESATVTLSTGEKAKFKNLVIGCSSTFEGSSFREADGVLGLGYSKHSFAAKATTRLGGKFSYCLVDHLSTKKVSSYISFGSSNFTSARMRYTNLLVSQPSDPFYAVEVVGISVNNTMLKIPRSAWDLIRDGGVIVDSGTSLTVLVEQAYRVVMAALSKALKSFPRVDEQPFEFCFDATQGYDEAAVPRLGVHFKGGARFEPAVKSYVVAVADGVKCLGFLPTTSPGVSMFGNILQQNFLWEFDIARGRLGFRPSKCAS